MELANASLNKNYIIDDIDFSISKSRLMAYGIYPGNIIKKVSSNKSMAIYQINNSHFAIRHNLAMTITISDYNA